MRFAREYVENVLEQNFEDAKTLFFQALMDVHYAHLIMLFEVGILKRLEAQTLSRALDRITPDRIRPVRFDGSFEDLFFYIERLLEDECGQDTAGKLHTARSRNDIDATTYRLRWREEVAIVQDAAIELRQELLSLSRREKGTIFPLFTHTQAAQPSTLAHYFMGVVEHLERDHRRLSSAFRAMNLCPLGSCAITGTGFPIDRHLTSRLLAFDGPTGNTHASIASVDYILEPVGALQILLTTLGKVLHDLLLWASSGFHFLRLSDEFVQPSSIMPQKRNPVSLEHSRALLSRGFGQSSAVFQMLHNTPFGDIVDIEDDLQPLVGRVFTDSIRPLKLIAAALRTAVFDSSAMNSRCGLSWSTMTELADILVRQEDLSFRSAHAIASRIVESLEKAPDQPLSGLLRAASRDLLGRELERSDAWIAEALNPASFVAVRKTHGGPSIEIMESAISESERQLQMDRDEIVERLRRFSEFRISLRETARSIG